jgi:tripartite-type tricarboxylate transporter receptor subunit TctC
MTLSRRQILRGAGAASLLATTPFAGHAQGAMLDQVKIITGFTPGGTSDTICRRVAAQMQGSYGRSVVVENRSGAGGQLAITAVKGMPADGTAILQTPMSMLGIYPHIYKKLPYDPVADLTPVSQGAVFDFGFAVGPAVPETVKTMAQFLAWVKANPDKGNFGSPAAGSTPHFIGVLAGRSAGVELKHVPYRGTQPAILDMIGGQIQAVSGPVGEFTQHVAAGKCRLLATTGTARSKFAPGVPTMVEQGMKDMAFNEWFGFYLPAKSPADVVQRANTALRAALAARETVEGLELMGLESKSSSPGELAAMLRYDSDRWAPLIKSIGFTADS